MGTAENAAGARNEVDGVCLPDHRSVAGAKAGVDARAERPRSPRFREVARLCEVGRHIGLHNTLYFPTSCIGPPKCHAVDESGLFTDLARCRRKTYRDSELPCRDAAAGNTG